MTDTVNLYDAKTNLSKLVDRAAAGEEIIIAKAGKPKGKLVPYQPPRKKSAGSGGTCWESPILPTILTDLCRPSRRSNPSRFRAAADRHAHPALGG
jgi:prevent-host-death family protein